MENEYYEVVYRVIDKLYMTRVEAIVYARNGFYVNSDMQYTDETDWKYYIPSGQIYWIERKFIEEQKEK
jgi:hypothetical protein